MLNSQQVKSSYSANFQVKVNFIEDQNNCAGVKGFQNALLVPFNDFCTQIPTFFEKVIFRKYFLNAFNIYPMFKRKLTNSSIISEVPSGGF